MGGVRHNRGVDMLYYVMRLLLLLLLKLGLRLGLRLDSLIGRGRR